MVRRSAGFVSKRPHKKSRGGCLTCKKRKVKCDEVRPTCAYCSIRKLVCNYSRLPTPTPGQANVQQDEPTDSNFSLPSPSSLIPVVSTSSGSLTSIDLDFIHHYKNNVWQSMSYRLDERVDVLNRDFAPIQALSKPYLLYTILAISASHRHTLKPNPRTQTYALVYRQKALGAYTEALSNITSYNYETLLMTSIYIMAMNPPPDLPCDDTTCLTWVSAIFNMMQGLRLLASLKWSRGIEKLTVYPMFRRELRNLPPPPILSIPPDGCVYPNSQSMDNDPARPNPPQTYLTPPLSSPSSPPPMSSGLSMADLPFRPQELLSAGKSPHSPPSWKTQPSWQIPAPAFLPPPLMALLKSMVEPEDSGPIDLHAPTLVPALHALSPIFLSLFYYRLNPDFYVRAFAMPTFLPHEFFALVARRESRALIIVGWWFAFVQLIPNRWWLRGIVPRVLHAISNEVMRCNDKMLMDAMEGAYRLVGEGEKSGRESAAKRVFDGWTGVYWEEGPLKEQAWRFGEVSNSESETG